MTRQSQPNFTTVTVDGKVGAVFPGGVAIEAADADAFTWPDTHYVEWTDGPGGARIAEIIAAYSPSAAWMRQGVQHGIQGFASLQMSLTALERSIRSYCNAYTFLVMDDGGRSGFLQVEEPVNGLIRRVAFGGGLLNFPGAAVSAALVVPHSLLTAPSFILADPSTFAGPSTVANKVHVQRTTSDANTLTFVGVTNTGAAIGPGNVGFHWLACSVTQP